MIATQYGRIGRAPDQRWHSSSESAKRASSGLARAPALGATSCGAEDVNPTILLQNQAVRRLSMKFRPLHDRVVVERIDAEAKSAGGIIIPDTAQEKPQQGKVVGVGPGGRDESGKLIPIDIKVGDRVLFGKWSGTEVKIDGIEYLIMKESDIMGVLVESEAKKKAA
jgi:chaperonin GroES